MFPGKRDEKIWLFSAWEGQKYADNSKYLYEYILVEHPEITCIWQTKNEAVFQMLKNEEKPVQLIGTIEAEKAQRQAGVVFYTNGLDDFGDFPQVYGAKIVALWHGVGLKKIYRMLRIKSKNPIKRRFSDFRWRFFSWVARDITVVTSEYSKKQFIEWFDLPTNSSILIAGQARNDVFAKKIEWRDAISNQKILDKIGNRKIILYMPTFRKQATNLMIQIKEIFTSDKFRSVLENNNAVFIAKLHYLNQGNLTSDTCRILLNDSDVIDSQILMACADMMVTDYSSCVIDFALTHRPVLYYFPDWDEYGAEKTMVSETKEVCSVNCAFSKEEFIYRVNEMLTRPENGLKQSEKLNELYGTTNILPGEFSQNTFDKVKKELKVKAE